MQLFFHSGIDKTTTHCFFDKDESQHIVKVLRRREGDLVYITNGKGWLFEGTLVLASPKRCEVAIEKATLQSRRSYYLHLVVAPTKMNERYEWFLEKATEIGVDEITPIICDHSERTVVKVERFEKIVLSAMKQSLQCYLPQLNAPISSREFFKRQEGDMSAKYIAHCQENEKVLFAKALSPLPPRITVLIGPEGDFSQEEIAIALREGFRPISLGNTRLRTETAAVVACHTVVVS
nr:16S rRNA (uracil(1498)-N(3))-methyltransferase [uncultured Capnocytophaga sp.]